MFDNKSLLTVAHALGLSAKEVGEIAEHVNMRYSVPPHRCTEDADEVAEVSLSALFNGNRQPRQGGDKAAGNKQTEGRSQGDEDRQRLEYLAEIAATMLVDEEFAELSDIDMQDEYVPAPKH